MSSTRDWQDRVSSPPYAQSAGESAAKHRKTGMDFLGCLPWGSHLCHFYQTKQDLIEIIVPYLRAGLESNEFCLWVTSDLLNPQEAFEAMMGVWPACESFTESGQIRFLGHSQWYLREGSFDPQRIVQTSVEVINRAVSSGCEGVRIAGNMSWVDKTKWQTLMELEKRMDGLNSTHPMLALCSYHLDRCRASEVVDVINCHHAAIFKHEMRWQLINNRTEASVAKTICGTGYADHKPVDKPQTDFDEQMRAVFDSVRDAIFLLDMAGKVIRVNRVATELLGYTEEDLVGKQFALLKMFPPSRSAEMFSVQARTLVGHDVPPFELEAVSGSGHKLQVEVRVFPMKRGNKSVGAMAVIRDITERRRAEERLRAATERNQLVVQNANEGIMVVQDGIVKFANPKMIEISGYSESELLLKPVTDLVRPEDRRTVATSQFKRLRGEDLSHVYDLRIVDKNGNMRWAEFNAVLFTWDGRPADLYFVNDVTQRKQAQEALIQAEKNYQHLFESALDGVEVIDSETGRILLANPACARIFGFDSPAEMVGIDPLEYIHTEDGQQIVSILTRSAFEKDLRRAENIRAVTRDGRQIWISAGGVSTEFRGKPAVLMFVRDITAQKHVEQASHGSQENLRAIFDGVQDGIILLDADNKITRVNQSFLETLGLAEEDIIGQQFDNLEMFTPESIRQIRSVVQGLPSGRDAGYLELEAFNKVGRKLSLEVRIAQLRKKEEDAAGSIVVLRDISHRKQAEEALRCQERYFRVLVENTPDASMVVDQSGVILYQSPHCERILRRTEQAGSNGGMQNVFNYLHPDDIAAVKESLRRISEVEGSSSRDEVRLRNDDGTSSVFEAACTNLLHDPGVRGILVNLRDISERHRIIQTLRESEGRYRLVAENVSDIIWIMDLNMKLTYVSPSVTLLRGYSVEEALAASAEDALTPESAVMAKKHVARLLKAHRGSTGQSEDRTVTAELEMKCKDGSTIWTETRFSLVTGVDGRPVGIIGITRDITRRRKVEEALRESEKRYRLLAENVSDVIWTADMNARPVYVSPSVERMLGYTVEEALSSSIETVLTPESARWAAEGLAKALSTIKRDPSKKLEPQEIELELRRKDGSTIWVHTIVNMVRDSDGRPVEIVGVLRDITLRRTFQKALSDSEERFRNLIETTSDWVWEVNEKFVYTYVSARIRTILGHEPQEVIGKTPYDLMPLKEADRMTKVFESALAQKKPFAFVEYAGLHKDGHEVVLETSGVPFFDADGNVCGFRGIDRDVTQRRRSEEEVQESLRKLQKTVEGTIQAIALTVETRDPYTAGHQRRVTQLAQAISREMGLSNDQIQKIRTAGLLHDLGKIFIPTEILSKPGQLTEIEFAIIKSHPQAGYEILKNVEFPWPIADIVVQHHERMNGSGYPFGLKNEDITIEARILAVADVVEAMSSHRPYRQALGLDKALKEVTTNRGILYDPGVVDACVRVFSDGVFKFDK